MFCWSKRAQGWNGSRGEKRIRNGADGASLKLKRLFMFPHSGVREDFLSMYLSPNGRQSKRRVGDIVLHLGKQVGFGLFHPQWARDLASKVSLDTWNITGRTWTAETGLFGSRVLQKCSSVLLVEGAVQALCQIETCRCSWMEPTPRGESSCCWLHGSNVAWSPGVLPGDDCIHVMYVQLYTMQIFKEVLYCVYVQSVLYQLYPSLQGLGTVMVQWWMRSLCKADGKSVQLQLCVWGMADLEVQGN